MYKLYMLHRLLVLLLAAACAAEDPLYTQDGPGSLDAMNFAMPFPSRPPWQNDDDAAGPLPIMPVGDSLTEGMFMEFLGGYRITLYDLLATNGNSFKFVGSNSSGPASLPDKANEGHSGQAIPYMTANVAEWVRLNPCRVMILLPGMAQIAGNQNPTQAPADLTTFLNTTHAANPGAILLLGKLSHIGVGGYAPTYSPYEQYIDPYNAQVAIEWAARSSYVIPFDLSAVNTNTLTTDGVHYNPTGYAEVGTIIYNAGKGKVWK